MKKSCRKLCWDCLGRYEQLSEVGQSDIASEYPTELAVVRLVTGNLVIPRAWLRKALEVFCDVIAGRIKEEQIAREFGRLPMIGG